MRKRSFFTLSKLAIFLVALIALSIFLLPKAEDRVLAKKQQDVIQKLEKQFQTESNTVNVRDNAIGEAVAILSIPKINIDVPVYYGTSDLILEKGIGVLEGTSDIDGGLGKHSVLTGHRGLSQSQLFTNLPKLAKQDTFSITTKNGERFYQVDSIKKIKAETLQNYPERYISVNQNKDQITLITCTPLYINSHRLLVRAHLVDKVSNDSSIQSVTSNYFMIIGIVVIVLITIVVFIKRRKHAKY